MNWEAIGAVGEILGATAVVISIIYLATQIRQNSQAVKSESVRQLLSQSSNLFLGTATSPEIIAAQTEHMPGQQAITEDEQRLDMLASAIFTNFENGYYQYTSGSLPEEIFLSYERRVSAMLQVSWARSHWELRSTRYGDSFREFVNGLATGEGPATTYT